MMRTSRQTTAPSSTSHRHELLTAQLAQRRAVGGIDRRRSRTSSRLCPERERDPLDVRGVGDAVEPEHCAEAYGQLDDRGHPPRRSEPLTAPRRSYASGSRTPGVARRGSILLVHGLGEHSGRYAGVAERLAAHGLAVRSYDLRGHGRSEGVRGSIPRADALLADLRCVFSDADRCGRASGDGSPPLLLGHSLGGTIAAAATITAGSHRVRSSSPRRCWRCTAPGPGGLRRRSRGG
jgi:pimeloyl-ACP methyl ester carboxylesterase